MRAGRSGLRSGQGCRSSTNASRTVARSGPTFTYRERPGPAPNAEKPPQVSAQLSGNVRHHAAPSRCTISESLVRRFAALNQRAGGSRCCHWVAGFESSISRFVYAYDTVRVE
jgi:hypothetical protein